MTDYEAKIKQEIRLAISRVGVVIWDQPVGVAVTGKRTITYGLCRGSADLIGLRKSDGRFVAIEVKTKIGMETHRRLLKMAQEQISANHPVYKLALHAVEQQRFVDLILDCEGLAGFATSTKEAVAIVTRDSSLKNRGTD